MSDHWSFETRQIHAGQEPDAVTGARAQLTAGVRPGLVRLSVGLEHITDILADLDAGFRAAKGA